LLSLTSGAQCASRRRQREARALSRSEIDDCGVPRIISDVTLSCYRDPLIVSYANRIKFRVRAASSLPLIPLRRLSLGASSSGARNRAAAQQVDARSMDFRSGGSLIRRGICDRDRAPSLSLKLRQSSRKPQFRDCAIFLSAIAASCTRAIARGFLLNRRTLNIALEGGNVCNPDGKRQYPDNL